MSHPFQDAERAALRTLAHAPGLPERIRRVIELVAEEVPPTPTATIAAPTDAAVGRLQAIDHIVVLMLENRLSDHMLGYRDSPESQICHA